MYKIISIAILLSCTSCSHVNKFLGLKDDHIVEEKTEEMLERNFEWELDFTPESRECRMQD